MKPLIVSNIALRIRKLKEPFVIVEVISFSIFALILGYFIDKYDPLFVKNSVNFNLFYIVLVIFSLFYGIGAGLLSLFIFFMFAVVYYSFFPTKFFLYGLLVALISGEFHFYWNRKIENVVAKAQYLDTKLREIGTQFLTLKISHDLLEKSYVSKPYTIRSLMEKIKEKKDIKNLLKFLANNFNVNKFAVIKLSDEGNIERVYRYNLPDDVDIDLNSPVIQKSLSIKEISFISDFSKAEQFDILASIPVLSYEEEVRYIAVIFDMPFLSFNEDNLLSFQAVLNYYFLYQEKLDKLIVDNTIKTRNIPLDKKLEILTLVKLYEISNIDTSIVIIKLEKKHSIVFANFLNMSLRALDFYIQLEKNYKDMFIVVLPIVGKEGAIGFINRVKNSFEFLGLENRFNIFSIKDFNLVEEIIEDFTK